MLVMLDNILPRSPHQITCMDLLSGRASILTGMSPITKPTSGLLALRAVAADTGELRTILRSAALLVFFDGEQTQEGGFKPAVGHDFFYLQCPVCLSFSFMLQGMPLNDPVLEKRGITGDAHFNNRSHLAKYLQFTL